MSFKRLIFTFGTLALALAAGPLAQAQDCKTTAECHKGFTCVLYTAKPEPTPPPTTDPAAPAKTSALVAPQSGYCQPAECASDSECGPNMVCHTETLGTCSGGSAPAKCAPNTDCGAGVPIAPPVCTETKVSRCAFTWQLPCSTDTECGAGFMCTPSMTASCSGSAGGSAGAGGGTTPTMGGTAPSAGAGTPSSGATAPAADLVAPVPPDRNCTTTTSFPGFCQPKATICASNTDCPMDFACTAVPSGNTGSPVSTRTTDTGTAGTSGTATPGGATPADAFVPPSSSLPAPTTTPTTMTCTSPYYGYGARGAEDSVGGTPTTTGGPPPSQGGNAGGAAGSGGLNPMSPTPTHETAGTGSSMPTGGCAVGGGSSSLALAAFALLGLVIARRRR